MITRRMVTNGDSPSESDVNEYDLGSPEANALLGWLSDNTQVLLPQEQETPALLSDMEAHFEAQQAQFEDDRSPYPQPDDEY